MATAMMDKRVLDVLTARGFAYDAQRNVCRGVLPAFPRHRITIYRSCIVPDDYRMRYVPRDRRRSHREHSIGTAAEVCDWLGEQAS